MDISWNHTYQYCDRLGKREWSKHEKNIPDKVFQRSPLRVLIKDLKRDP